MAGSLLQVTDLGSAYNNYWEYTPLEGSISWADSSTGIFTVPATPAHPFVTGDVMYVRLLNSNFEELTQTKCYAIVLSSTQLKFASTKENALNGISLSIPANLGVPLPGARGSGIGNTPVCGYNFWRTSKYFTPNEWNASARSGDSFDVSTNVRIEITQISNSVKAGASYALATSNFSSCFGLAFWAQSLAFHPSDASYFNTSLTGTLRFEIINRRISLSGKLQNGSFVTVYTSSEFPVNSAPFYFYANLGINSMSASDCTVTYL